jgi:hypothetical protein
MKMKIECDGREVSGVLECSTSEAADALICLGREYAHWAAIIAVAGMALLGEAGSGNPTQAQIQALTGLLEIAKHEKP